VITHPQFIDLIQLFLAWSLPSQQIGGHVHFQLAGLPSGGAERRASSDPSLFALLEHQSKNQGQSAAELASGM